MVRVSKFSEVIRVSKVRVKVSIRIRVGVEVFVPQERSE